MNAYINTPIRVLLQLISGVNYLEALRSVHSSADGFGPLSSMMRITCLTSRFSKNT